MTAEDAYLKAKKAQKRMPELEPIILTQVGYSCMYASDVIKGRWPEAEPIIIERADYACEYAQNVIQGRWPEAEEMIAKSILKEHYIALFFPHGASVKPDINEFLWNRHNLYGYFAPVEELEPKISLLDVL